MLYKIRDIIRSIILNIRSIDFAPIKWNNYNFRTFRNKRKFTLIINFEQLQGDVLFRISLGFFKRNIGFDAFIGWAKPGKLINIKEFDYRILV